MKRKKKNGIVWLEFELLGLFPEVKQAVFLNLELGEKSSPENLKHALKLLEIEKGVKLKQCHKADIKEVRGVDQTLTHFDDFDGVVTNQKEIGLLIRHADCQGAIFYDPVNHALGNVHCGWRGSVLNIYQKIIIKMKTLYGTDPSDLIVCIGPSLGPENAEFKHYKEELPESFWEFQVRPTYFDFWEISRMQLTKAGVPKEQIEIAEICTYENHKEYFSYRRNKATPHHGTLVALL